MSNFKVGGRVRGIEQRGEVVKKKTDTKKKKRVQKRDTFNQLADLIGKFLDENGWKVLVVGPVKIREDLMGRKFNYELVIGFTGAKKEVKP